jgi:uncharacterized protein with NAD-binding domain and iron-sulfur cluster
LAAAYHLTVREPGAYDITIYETSWRLGGKTASGRGVNGRIEEHGLHVLFGSYHNAFRLMLDCYNRMAGGCGVGPERHKFQHFLDAVEPRHFGVIGDDRLDARDLGALGDGSPDGGKHWLPWYLQFPCNGDTPGDAPLPSPYTLASLIVQVLVHVIAGARGLRLFQRSFRWLLGYKRRLPRRKDLPLDPPAAGAPASEPLGGFAARWLLALGYHLLDDGTRLGRAVRGLCHSAHRLVHRVKGLNNLRLLRRGAVGSLWTVMDFGLAVIKGIIHHGLLVSEARRRTDPRAHDPAAEWGSYDRIDDWDFRAWLGHHGAAPETLGSPLVRTLYDAAFSYVDGGRADPETGELDGESLAAGTALRICVLMAFTFKHAYYYKMRAGMGDVISAPLYLVLRAKGVKFKFFHRVTAVKPGRDENGEPVIDQIELAKVARVHGEYEPLEERGNLQTWPSRPHPDRIDPDDYEEACNAEHYLHKPTRDYGREYLRRGADFDAVVLGIPVSCLPYVCADLIREGRRLRAQPADDGAGDPAALWARQPEIATVQTVSLQLWLKPTLEELGWHRSPPLLSLFFDPLNTWCDMGQVLAQEEWPAGLRPGSVAYFCGPLPHQHPLPNPEELAGATDAQLARLHARVGQQAQAATDRLLNRLQQLLPNVAGVGGPDVPAFEFSLLADPQRRPGAARLAAQYLRPNIEPSERCTLALPGQTRLRMAADQTGYANLFVTGDWTKNGIYAACFEGAVQAGIRTARAISRRPELYTIAAEELLGLEPPPPPRPRVSPVRPAATAAAG